jgi:hypothetical protein
MSRSHRSRLLNSRTLLPVGLVLPFLGVSTAKEGLKPRLDIREVAAIAIPGCPGFSIEDAANGMLLLQCGEGTERGDLFVWDMSQRALGSQLHLAWWPGLKSRTPRPFSDYEPGPFRFLGSEGGLVGIAGCQLVTVARESFRKLDLPADICDPNSPFVSHLRYSKWHAISVNRQQTGFAVAFNIGSKPRLVLFHRDSQRPYITKELPRYVNDVAWSPDGHDVAVLYSGYVDNSLRWVASTPGARLTLPDLSIFDTQTGKEEMAFFSGGPEAKLEYAPDGRLIYCISQNKFLGYSWGDWGKETIKVLSAADGTLIRTIRVSRNGVRNNFTLSPDGKLIAADASTDLFRFLQEPDFLNKMGRFVLLGAQNGDSLYEYHASMDGKVNLPIKFAFAPDGRMLFVDFNGGGVVSYSISVP